MKTYLGLPISTAISSSEKKKHVIFVMRLYGVKFNAGCLRKASQGATFSSSPWSYCTESCHFLDPFFFSILSARRMLPKCTQGNASFVCYATEHRVIFRRNRYRP